MFREIADFYVATSLLGKGASSKVYLVKEKDKEKKQFASKCIEKTYLMQDGGYVKTFLLNNYFMISNLYSSKSKICSKLIILILSICMRFLKEKALSI